MRKIVLFDGVCNLCNDSIQFILRHDKKEQFQFASLQSEFAKSIAEAKDINTVVYLRGKKTYTKTAAAIHILSDLYPIMSWMKFFLIFPPFIRDIGYNLVAKFRYRIWGKMEQCMAPNKALKKRFLV